MSIEVVRDSCALSERRNSRLEAAAVGRVDDRVFSDTIEVLGIGCEQGDSTIEAAEDPVTTLVADDGQCRVPIARTQTVRVHALFDERISQEPAARIVSDDAYVTGRPARASNGDGHIDRISAGIQTTSVDVAVGNVVTHGEDRHQ
ncbi:MAG TPA: hypothetical protein VG369_09140 [Humibacter sp.]|nr:hypothetical protein [Humibacter sp.]